jgi:hypothetical protein
LLLRQATTPCWRSSHTHCRASCDRLTAWLSPRCAAHLTLTPPPRRAVHLRAPRFDPLPLAPQKLGEVSWQSVTIKNEGPSPRSGHSIVVAPSIGKAIVFGGCGVSGADASSEAKIFNETWLISTDGIGNGEAGWELADVMGDVPVERWRHTATLLPSGNEMLIFGGLAGCVRAQQ